MRRNRRSHCLFSMGLLAGMLLTGFVARAQTPRVPASLPIASPTPSLEKEFFRNILRDQKALWTAPFRVQRKDARWIVPSAMGLMALFTTDRMTGDKLAKFDRQLKTSRRISYAGSGYSLGATVATFYLVGRITHDTKSRETGLLSAEALIDSAIVGSGLKGITQRARPQAGRERSEFFDGGSSFPSGHSIQVWSVATVIAHEYHERRIIQLAAYGVASAVSVARFAGARHYISDVLVGSALGYGIGHYVYHKHHRKEAKGSTGDARYKPSAWPSIMPQYKRSARQYGVAFMWSF